MYDSSFISTYYQLKEIGIYKLDINDINNFFEFIINKLEKYQSEGILNTIEHLINDKRYFDSINFIKSDFDNDLPIILSELNFNFIEGKLEYISLIVTLDLVRLLGMEDSSIMIHVNPQICGFEDDDFLKLDKEEIILIENKLINTTLRYLNNK